MARSKFGIVKEFWDFMRIAQEILARSLALIYGPIGNAAHGRPGLSCCPFYLHAFLEPFYDFHFRYQCILS